MGIGSDTGLRWMVFVFDSMNLIMPFLLCTRSAFVSLARKTSFARHCTARTCAKNNFGRFAPSAAKNLLVLYDEARVEGLAARPETFDAASAVLFRARVVRFLERYAAPRARTRPVDGRATRRAARGVYGFR